MLRRVIAWSVENKFLVLFATAAVTAAGIVAAVRTPVDAIPDLSDVQVIVTTDWEGQAPQTIEDQVTYPLSTALLKVPRTKFVRGVSQFGRSYVYVVFEDDVDLYWARSRVLEYLNSVRKDLPAEVQPQLGPDATGVGWVFQYLVVDTSGQYDLARLRSVQDWTLRYELQSVDGVAEVASLGGFEKQYQVEVRPERLLAYGIPIADVARAIRMSNQDVGARVLELGGTEYMIRGRGYLRGVDDIRQVAVGVTPDGTPIRVGDVADVHVGPEMRRGIADLDGQGEVVTGFVIMRFGENPLVVIDRVKLRIGEIAPGLPQGVVVLTGYDRSSLIHRAIATLRRTLLEEAVIVALVALVFLLHARSALVAILMLPVAILMAFLAMRWLGINANIMSLGGIAIAIGAMIDAAIVMIENVHKHLEHDAVTNIQRPRWRLVVEASQEVGPSLFYSLLIITVSFIPVFALSGQSGRLFTPLAWTKTLSMAAAAFLSITLVPVLMGYLVRGRIRPQEANPLNRWLMGLYRPVIAGVLRYPRAVIAGAAVVLAATALPWSRLGSEFMPPLDEGSLLFMPTTVPGVSIAQARSIMRYQDSVLAAFPEVASVFGKVGRANTATDPAPLDMYETTVVLKPQESWRSGMTTERLIGEMDRAVRLPGVTNAWTMPIKNRIDMLATGVRTPVGVKIYGSNLDTLQRLGEQVEQILRDVPGTRNVFAERNVSGYYVDVRADRAEAARFALNAGDLHDVVMATAGGMTAAITVEGRERYEVNVRYPRELRDNVEKLREIVVPTMSGVQVPLGQLARVTVAQGPMAVKTDNAFPVTTVYVDIEGRDLGGYVRDAQRVVARELTLPAAYHLTWSGQFEFMERVREKLKLVVPLTLGIIFLLLYLNFRGVSESLIVMLALPFGLVGGVWSIWALGYNTSVAVWVGFIALAGVAAETGVIMLIYLDEAYHLRRQAGVMRGAQDVAAAVVEGAVERLRPKLMTVVAIMAGLAPILWGHGTGADVMKRIAAPMVGGMVTSTMLTLIVIPAIYYLWRRWQVRRERAERNAPVGEDLGEERDGMRDAGVTPSAAG